ncbi:MAG: hypothetical protein PHT79_09795 [Syntrophomonadaceae bacterium]|nr:hypothetical protein [Syntrophomonadaceae bacterium]MDD4550034.1 hypothetical protein [Syntrophomonadaceae bacterium]
MKRYFILICLAIVLVLGYINIDFIFKTANNIKNTACSQAEDIKYVIQYYEHGKRLKNLVTFDNNKVILAYVNNEPISLSDFNWVQNDPGQKHSTQRVFKCLADWKIQAAAARALNLYPDKIEILQCLENEKQYLMNNKYFKAALKGWGISFDEYVEITKGQMKDKLAIGKWQAHLYDNVIPKLPDDKSPSLDEAPAFFVEEAIKEYGGLDVRIIEAGEELGLKSEWVYQAYNDEKTDI